MLIRELLESDTPVAKIRTPYATSSFVKNYNYFKTMPGFEKNFDEWLHYYETEPNPSTFGLKDAGFVGNNEIGRIKPTVRHYHAVHGQAIVIYQLTDNEIKMIDVVDHSAISTPGLKNLAKVIKNLTPASYTPWSPDVTQIKKWKKIKLTPEELEEIIKLFVMFKKHPSEHYILEEMVQGDFTTFLQWARMAINLEPDDTSLDKIIINRLQGPAGIKKWAGEFLKSAKTSTD